MNVLSAEEIAKFSGYSHFSICHKAKKLHWPFVLDSSHGGRPRKLYYVDHLPPEIRQAIRAATRETQAASSLSAWKMAAPWQRREAEARAALTRACLTHLEAGGRLCDFCEALADGVILHHPGEDDGEILALTGVVSERTLRRFMARFRDEGPAGLLPGPRGHGGQRLTPRHRTFLTSLLYHNPKRRIQRLYLYLKAKFDDAPSYATVRRFCRRWAEANREFLTFVENPDAWRSRYQAAFGNASEVATFYNEIWEMDATPADVMCLDGRHKIAGLIDVYARQPMILVTPTTAYTAQAALMRRGMMEMGIPSVIRKDNGKEYACQAMEAACGAFGIETPTLPPFTPEAKPHIERFFRTLATSLFEELPGFVGHNVAERKAIEARRSFAERLMTPGEMISVKMTAAKLQETIDAWIRDVYMQRPHKGLNGKRPVEMIAASPEPTFKVQDPRVLDVLLAPVGERVVQKKGIAYKNGWYQAPELALYVGRRVFLHEDLTDVGRLVVYDEAQQFVCVAVDAALEGMSVEDIVAARKRQRKEMLKQRRALKEIAGDVDPFPIFQEIEAAAGKAGRVLPAVREEVFESDAIREAMKAFEARRAPKGILDELDPIDVRLKSEDRSLKDEERSPKDEEGARGAEPVPLRDDEGPEVIEIDMEAMMRKRVGRWIGG